MQACMQRSMSMRWTAHPCQNPYRPSINQINQVQRDVSTLMGRRSAKIAGRKVCGTQACMSGISTTPMDL